MTPSELGQSLPDRSTAEPRFDLGAPRWVFECLECEAFDTYGYEDVKQLALEHVRETGHTLNVSRREGGWLRPAVASDDQHAPASTYEVVKMFDGTWNVREQPSGEWVRDAVHLSKPDATRRAEEMNSRAS